MQQPQNFESLSWLVTQRFVVIQYETDCSSTFVQNDFSSVFHCWQNYMQCKAYKTAKIARVNSIIQEMEKT